MNFDIWKRLWAVLLNFNFWSRRGWRRLSSLSVFFSRGILSGRIGNSLNR